MVHIVNKGKTGEREIATLLRGIIYRVVQDEGYDEETANTLYMLVQRNQNQSAEGGGDINLLGISFEVKRQEGLAINQWWKQCTTSAARNGDVPVLMYRQNHKAWNVVMMVNMYVTPTMQIPTRAQVDMVAFEAWFYQWVKAKVAAGELGRV